MDLVGHGSIEQLVTVAGDRVQVNRAYRVRGSEDGAI